MSPSPAAIKDGLIDELSYLPQVEKALAKKAGLQEPVFINPQILLGDLHRSERSQRLAFLVAEGDILRGAVSNPFGDDVGLTPAPVTKLVKEIGDDAQEAFVPSMLLQPLIENCVKHGLSSKVEGGTIRLRSRRVDSRLLLSVEDDGVGIPESKLATLLDQGIGVSNVSERLKVLFGNDHKLNIESQPGRGTRVEIEIPELQTSLVAVS